MLLRHATNNIINETIVPLFNKRILFNRFEFEHYICSIAKKEITYKRFYEQDFDPDAILDIKEKLHTLNQTKKLNRSHYKNICNE